MISLPHAAHVPARTEDALLYTLPISQELADLLAPRVMRTTERIGRCWLRSEGYQQKNGYSYISHTVDGKRKYYLAHRISFVHYFGPIPDGLTIDHLCERPACVNPKHLQAVTHRQNVLRSRTNPYAINARRTCEHGQRRCPICKSQQRAAARLQRKESGVPSNEEHGTRRGYHWWSCRCEACQDWRRAEYLEAKGGNA